MRKPTHLRKEAYAKYESLEKILGDKLKEGDENLLAVLANSFLIYKKFNDEIMDRPVTKAGDKMVRQNPAWNMTRDCAKLIADLSKHFGFSPWSRGEDLGGEPEKPDDLDKI